MVEMGVFHLLICEAQLPFAAHQKYILSFVSFDGRLREFGLCFPLLFISVKQEAITI